MSNLLEREGDKSSDTSVIQTEVIACPLCGETKHKIVVKAEDPQCGISGTFQVVACKACGHRYMNPAPTAQSIADCYPDDYRPHQNLPTMHDPAAEQVVTDTKADTRPWYLKHLPLKKIPGLRRFFYWLLDDKSQLFPKKTETNCRAFELGCAAGAYLQRLQVEGWDVQGLELGVDAANTAVQAGMKVDQGTLSDHRYPSDTYDWVALWMVLEHVPDPRATLSELFRMQAPGGTLVFSVPNAGCWEPFVFRRHWDAWDLPRHLHHFCPSTIRRLLEECGFVDVKIHHQRTLLNVLGSVGVWITSWMPESRFGWWLRNYPHRPRLWVQLSLAPFAQLLGMLRQGGRLTITATKPSR